MQCGGIFVDNGDVDINLDDYRDLANENDGGINCNI